MVVDEPAAITLGLKAHENPAGKGCWQDSRTAAGRGPRSAVSETVAVVELPAGMEIVDGFTDNENGGV